MLGDTVGEEVGVTVGDAVGADDALGRGMIGGPSHSNAHADVL